jgi:hypothetical protein
LGDEGRFENREGRVFSKDGIPFSVISEEKKEVSDRRPAVGKHAGNGM